MPAQGGAPSGGKRSGEPRVSGVCAIAPVLTHSHSQSTPGTASRGRLRGAPPRAGRDLPGEGLGVSPCPPAELFVCLILSRISLGCARRPPRTFPAFLQACPRPLLAPAPQIFVPQRSAARKRVPVPRYTQNQPLHTHIPPATPISVALPSLTYPGSGGAEPSLTSRFLYQGMRFFSVSVQVRGEGAFWGCPGTGNGAEFGLGRSDTGFTAQGRGRGRSASRWAGMG